MADDDDDGFIEFVDLDMAPAHVDRLVEAILNGERERAIDLLCETYPALVSYQHQAAIHRAIQCGKSSVAEAGNRKVAA